MAGAAARRTVVIGLDAATFDVIGPWIEDDSLPNLHRLVQEGASGSLLSTIHPLSPTAWASAVTGTSPGKHGVFDWRERDARTYHAQMVSSRSIEGPSIWEVLSVAGYSAGVVNVPLTYPPHALDGYLVSGILTPHSAKVFTYPQGLTDELHEVCGGYRTFFGQTYWEGAEQRFLDAIFDTLERRRRAVLHLLRTRPTDFSMMVFMESDHVQHDFWKYSDSGHPGHRLEHSRYRHAIRDVFVALDAIIGDVMELLPEDTTIFVMSDHGAGPLYKVVYLDKYLVQCGLMRLKGGPLTRLKRGLLSLDLPARAYRAVSALGLDVRRAVPKKYRTQLMDAGMSKSDVDWSRTRAYTCGDFGQICVNLRGREAFGCVPEADYETVREEVIGLLNNLGDPETGDRVVDHVYRREEVYSGPELERAPDIIFSMKGYSYVTSRSLGLNSSALMEPLRFGRSGNSGGHTPYGMLIARGPHIRAGQTIEGAQLIDIAPTVLYSMGMPVPRWMDGRPLTELFMPQFLARHPLEYAEDERGPSPGGPEGPYAQEDDEEVARRLRGLGYLG